MNCIYLLSTLQQSRLASVISFLFLQVVLQLKVLQLPPFASNHSLFSAYAFFFVYLASSCFHPGKCTQKPVTELGGNVSLALRASWGNSQVFSQLLTRLPAGDQKAIGKINVTLMLCDILLSRASNLLPSLIHRILTSILRAVWERRLSLAVSCTNWVSEALTRSSFFSHGGNHRFLFSLNCAIFWEE